jgi:hypothetical protein
MPPSALFIFYLRVAEHDGRIYLDLAAERWRAVEIGPDGWQVVSCPPVRFRRAAGLLPLPIRGGSLEALNSFFNLPTPTPAFDGLRPNPPAGRAIT